MVHRHIAALLAKHHTVGLDPLDFLAALLVGDFHLLPLACI